MAGLRHSILTFCKAETSAMVASVADFGLTVLLTEVVGVWYAYATLMGAVTGAVINCCVNYRWVFSAAGLSKSGVALRYLAVWIGSIALNTTGTYLFTELTGINYIISKIENITGQMEESAITLLDSILKYKIRVNGK